MKFENMVHAWLGRTCGTMWPAPFTVAKEKGEPVAIRGGYPISAAQIEAVMRGEIPVEKVPSLRVAPR